MSLRQAPSPRVVVDLDHPSLGITEETRCDYLLVTEAHSKVHVVPIEMKRGSLSATHVSEQLQAGANYAQTWLPHLAEFVFLPVLAHNGLPKAERNRLRGRRVKFRSRSARITAIRCGAPLAV